MSKIQLGDGCVQTPMPLYKCHKEVWALKIKEIRFDWEDAKEENRETDGSAIIVPDGNRFAPFKVDHQYVSKHLANLFKSTIEGGYYVVYKDGYKSFSPAAAFEEGYTLVG
jgi:hypothetical protein